CAGNAGVPRAASRPRRPGRSLAANTRGARAAYGDLSDLILDRVADDHAPARRGDVGRAARRCSPSRVSAIRVAHVGVSLRADLPRRVRSSQQRGTELFGVAALQWTAAPRTWNEPACLDQ